MTRPFRSRRSRQTPVESKSNDSHTHVQNRVWNPSELMLYSITLRRGQGIDLGKNSPDRRFIDYIQTSGKKYIVSQELGGNAAHFQILLETSKTIEQLKSEIRYIYFHWTDNQKRHALHIVPHNDEQTLIEYCCKQYYVEDYQELLYNPIVTSYRRSDLPLILPPLKIYQTDLHRQIRQLYLDMPAKQYVAKSPNVCTITGAPCFHKLLCKNGRR